MVSGSSPLSPTIYYLSETSSIGLERLGNITPRLYLGMFWFRQ
nr:MAG TPA: hypothetical protein [Caudoviricetes sp.]